MINPLDLGIVGIPSLVEPQVFVVMRGGHLHDPGRFILCNEEGLQNAKNLIHVGCIADWVSAVHPCSLSTETIQELVKGHAWLLNQERRSEIFRKVHQYEVEFKILPPGFIRREGHELQFLTGDPVKKESFQGNLFDCYEWIDEKPWEEVFNPKLSGFSFVEPRIDCEAMGYGFSLAPQSKPGHPIYALYPENGRNALHDIKMSAKVYEEFPDAYVQKTDDLNEEANRIREVLQQATKAHKERMKADRLLHNSQREQQVRDELEQQRNALKRFFD